MCWYRVGRIVILRKNSIGLRIEGGGGRYWFVGEGKSLVRLDLVFFFERFYSVFFFGVYCRDRRGGWFIVDDYRVLSFFIVCYFYVYRVF